MYDSKLDVFVTVSQYLNFSEAAAHLHIAQSAVSRNIAELEKELDIKLFDRTRRGCLLTPAGEVFLDEAFKIITLANSVKGKIVNFTAGESGEIVAGYPSELMIDPLVPCLKEFTKNHPNITLHFTTVNSLSVASMLRKGELDVAFGREESFYKREEIEWRKIFVSPLNVVLPEDHPLAGEEKLTLDMLENETLVLLTRAANPGFFDVVQKMFMAKGMTPLLGDSVSDRHSSLLLVRLGKGVTILSKQYMVRHDTPGLVNIPINDEYAHMDIGMAWKKEVVNPTLNQFLKEIDVFLSAHPDSVIQF